MNKSHRYGLLIGYVIGFLSIFSIIYFILNLDFFLLVVDWSFIVLLILFGFSIEEFFVWAKNGKRSELSDIVAMAFFFFIIFIFTKDYLTSLMGAFSIYLWIGIYELKEYPVINKLLIISLVTYNMIFIAGLISNYLEKANILSTSIVLDTVFAFSFWIILGLGFILFGRKYLVVWRFMSPQYLIIILYVIGWIFVVSLNEIFNELLDLRINIYANIYLVLIAVNIIIYFVSGAMIDKLLGIKEVNNEKLLKIVEDVKKAIGIKGKVKVGFGKYPILNAQAYGPFFDRRIAIIANDLENIKEDELKGIIAHELAHTKGNHILILTFIQIGDLIIRWILGFPATFYDYTFGSPNIDLIYFIMINIGVYIILYFFVRILEGYADLRTKEAGYKVELAKALYNLESFYASGRETGLNTMLLCDEKITNDNQILDYIDTAKYLSNSMINPSKISLLSNFLNSHPPSYHRIAAILGDDIGPYKEAILPILCVKNSKRKKYAKKFEMQIQEFKQISNNKFKELFKIDNISNLFESFKIKELYLYEFEKNYLFKNVITDEYILGKIQDIKFLEDISDNFQYIVQNLKNNEIEYLNSTLYSKIAINFNDMYFFNGENPLKLHDIEFNQKKTDGNYIFLDINQNKVYKKLKKTKLPLSIDFIKTFKGKEVFLKSKGELKILECKNIDSHDTGYDYTIELANYNNNDNEKEIIRLKLDNIIVRPYNIHLSISGSKNKTSEIDLLNWIEKKKIRTYFYLKKPVNNIEIGYLKKITRNKSSQNKKNSLNDKHEIILTIENIFKKLIDIHLDQIDLVSFSYETGTIQLKSEKSLLSKLGYRIIKKLRPQEIIYQ
ncbi:MAG: M48 family metalloprotease [Candidatus Lokiarchaeota archaeon]|nr:M48 family metalloprotease [Candidatus Lokiarchaeota archaeon]